MTKSRNGRAVELLQIGEPGPGKKAVLVTGRHHAAETIASHVLEGFLHAAMADDAPGKAFREQYVLFAVPFVDKDGVEEGDQGKNRKPHDHNRDYGEKSIYPEVQAIRDLDKAKNFELSLDFHCPLLVAEDHQVMHFVGAKDHPVSNFDNVTELARGIKARLPKDAPGEAAGVAEAGGQAGADELALLRLQKGHDHGGDAGGAVRAEGQGDRPAELPQVRPGHSGSVRGDALPPRGPEEVAPQPDDRRGTRNGGDAGNPLVPASHECPLSGSNRGPAD